MIPILYGEKEWEFGNNGLGRLSDAIFCEVTEERNGIYQLEMDYPVNGAHYDSIKLNTQIFAIPSATAEGGQPFVIEHIGVSIDNVAHIFATHVSYKMSYYPVKPYKNKSSITAKAALNAVLNNVVGANSFTVTTDKLDKAVFSVEAPTSLKSILLGKEGSLLDLYGGTWEFDRYRATLKAARGRSTDVVIRYGKDLESIEYEASREELFTGCLPYWQGTQKSGNNDQETVFVFPDSCVKSQYADLLPWRRDIAVDVTQMFDENEVEKDKLPTKQQVIEKGQQYLKENVTGTEEVTIRVELVPLWQVAGNEYMRQFTTIGMCDEVTVYHAPLGLYYTGNVVKTVYDVLSDRYTSLEIGLLKPTLTDIIGDTK